MLSAGVQWLICAESFDGESAFLGGAVCFSCRSCGARLSPNCWSALKGALTGIVDAGLFNNSLYCFSQLP